MIEHTYIAPCFEGPIDIIGDVHGEVAVLRELLDQLGYSERGAHPQGRRLVFIGDLVDRGPDSPAVIEWVREAVEQGFAQCLLGNHELMLLLQESKEGCRWYADPAHPETQPGGKFAHSKPAPEALKPVWREFVAGLPVALERADLRLVHAAWHQPAIDRLRHETRPLAQLYHDIEQDIEAALQHEGLLAAESAEKQQYAQQLAGPGSPPPLLQAMAQAALRRNLDHPLRTLTYGPDCLATAPVYVMERWRMTARSRWWNAYHDDTPVVFGHYWRKLAPASWPSGAPRMPAVFEPMQPQQWFGARGNVFCNDFSIGARFLERNDGAAHFNTHLAALRWPERELWFETGRWTPASD